MKLLQKTIRDYLRASFSILAITAAALFIFLRYEIVEEMNEQLELEVSLIIKYAKSGQFAKAPLMEIKKVKPDLKPVKIFGDSTIYDFLQGKYEDYHYIRVIENLNGDLFQITAMTSYIGWRQFYLSIAVVFSVVGLLLTLSGVAITLRSSKQIWSPFYQNLDAIRGFSANSSHNINLSKSNIYEFSELSKTLDELTERCRREYITLQQFTESASHEIQTPLSIIHAKLDRISRLGVNDEVQKLVVEAKQGTKRLSKINKRLLLLVKLDNKAGFEKTTLFLHEIVKTNIDNMRDLFENKSIALTLTTQPLIAEANKFLFETMLINLLSNALSYTPRGKGVAVILNYNSLTIVNDGVPLEFPEGNLFNRFVKGSTNNSSSGLGLAIVLQICKNYDWLVTHEFTQNRHIFRVKIN